jgi:ABC-type transport system substrate-binding protein
MALVPLMYEGLFVLNEKLKAENVLCERFETPDGINYTFILKPNIAMSDGSTLNATDVKYSLTSAMQKGRFIGRFSNIASITAVDSLTLKITLTSANYRLPELLDIPIIKYGSINNNYPPGSGPYYFDSGTLSLISMKSYRDAANVPIPEIQLKGCSNTELSVAFSAQYIDLFWNDPAGSSDISILSDHEIRYYNTTILQFVGFNVKNKLLSSANFRRALGLIIDRKNIVSTVYSSHALAAPLILSPYYSQYDTAWENSDSDPLSELSTIFSSLKMDDTNSDGFLEIPDANGVYTPMTLTFIVNADNKYKVAAAQMITDSLKTVGINVNLTKLSWDAYMTALTNGGFDMYYGDVCLPADYDLSELLSPGGSLDYGHAASPAYQSYIESFLAAADDDKEKAAANKLCTYIKMWCPV